MRTKLFLMLFAGATLAVAGCGDKGSDAGDEGVGDGGDDDGDGGSAGSTGNIDPSATGGPMTSGATLTQETMGIFIVEPDGGGDFQCDNWAQDCMDGEKCSAWANDGGGAWNATKCVPVDDDAKVPGDTCTVQGNGVSGIDDCELGAYCWDVDPMTNMGICVPLCKGTPDDPLCDDPGTDCLIANDGVLNLCLGICNPLLMDCAGDDLCVPNDDKFLCVLDADPENDLLPGDDCGFANVCNPPGFCGNPASNPLCNAAAGGCCIPFCDLTDAASCDAFGGAMGVICTEWYDPAMVPPGYEDLGACVIPA